jgi:hypothetical protein
MADTDNIDLLAGKIAELADKLAGPGAEAALAAARVSAMSALSGGVIALVIAGVAVWGARRLWAVTSEDRYSELPVASKVGAGFLVAGAFIATLTGVWAFADPWTWTALNNPELWIAKRLLGL